VSPARLAAVLSLLGGALWIVQALLGAGSDPLASTLHFLGLACLLVASAVFGATLVKSDAVAMRVVVALASGLLTLSLIEAFRPPDTSWYDGFWGAVAVLIGGIALLRGRGRSGRPSAGAHAR
jgi:hypothetical protein